MKRTLLISALMLTLGAFSVGAQDATPEATPDTATDATGVALTIYNQGTALVRDTRSFDLVPGVNTVDFTDVAAGIDPTSVTLRALNDPALRVLEQNYIFDLVDSAALLGRYLDQRIEVFTDDGTTFTGTLLSGRAEIILRQDDGQVVVISPDNVRDVRFPDLPGGLITRPTLRWLLESTGGAQPIELTYLTSGLNWTADYNVLLSADNNSLDLNGWVTLTNTSGAAYVDALVKLVAGDVNRLPQEFARMETEEAMLMDAAVAAPAPQVEQREIFEYNLYEIQRPVSVGANETKQVEFVTGTNVTATTFYVYNASQPYYFGGGPITDQFYGSTGITDVQTYLEFNTSEETGLGADLPAGRIRVYQEDIDGAALLIGENFIDHTPEGENVEIFLGNAFNLVGERIQTSYNLISNNVIEESYEIRLRNRGEDRAVEIRVPEHLFRWSDWEITATSTEFVQTDSNTIEFRTNVEPGGEVVITYTVRYTF